MSKFGLYIIIFLYIKFYVPNIFMVICAKLLNLYLGFTDLNNLHISTSFISFNSFIYSSLHPNDFNKHYISLSKVCPTINPSFYMYFNMVFFTSGIYLTLNPSIKYILSLFDIWISAAYSYFEFWDFSNLVCPTID